MTRALTKTAKRGGHPVDFQDKSLHCTNCGSTFTFSGGQQKFYQTNGFNSQPRRCPWCHQTKKGVRNCNACFPNSNRLQMSPVQGAECGLDTEVPFDPQGNKQNSVEIISKNQCAWLSQFQISRE
jgi:hypothetical protein